MKTIYFKFKHGKLTIDADIFDAPIAIESCDFFFNTDGILDRIWTYLFYQKAIKTEFADLKFNSIGFIDQNRICYCEGSFLSNL